VTFPYSAIRYPSPVAVGQRIRLNTRAVERLQLRQVNVKEAFTLQDKEGRWFRASYLASDGNTGEALVYEQMTVSPESPITFSLFCAVLARQRMFLVIQKATELGAARVQPVFSERSVGPDGLAHEKAHAWPNVAVRAAKQSRRASLPEVPRTLPLAQALAGDAWQGSEARFYLDDRAAQSPIPARGPQTVCLAVGPEGGWTDEERGSLEEAGAKPLLLGGRVLRAETAAVVGVTLLQHWLGDLASEDR
jgi:16S rRNA (uracil1498-N3)-methyltransferase